MSKKYEKDKLHILNKFMALLVTDAPDTGNLLFNIVQYPSDFDEVSILGNGPTFEEACLKALEYVGYYAQCYHEMVPILEDFSSKNYCSRGKEIEFLFNQVNITDKFCVEAWSMSPEQIKEEGPRQWNAIIKDEKGEWHLCSC